MIPKSFIQISLIASTLVFLTGCLNVSSTVKGRRDLEQPPKKEVPQYKKEDPYTPTWVPQKMEQQEFEFNPRADILFVIDNSASMSAAQENLSKNINRFVSGFTKNAMIDYHIGLISVWDSSERFANAKQDPYGIGELRHPRDRQGILQNHRFITRGMNVTETLAATLKIGIVSYDQGGPEVEEIFSPLAAALSKGAPGGINADFFREDAQLIVVIISDADDSTSKDPSNPAMSLSPEQMAQKLFDFKAKSGGRDKVSVYAALVSKSDSDEYKDFGLKVHPSYHPECFEGKLRIPGKCDAGFGPDRLEEFVVVANSGRATPKEIKDKHIMSLTQKDFGNDLAKIGSDISVKVLAKEILLAERPRSDENGKVMVRVQYGTPEALANGKGQLIPQQQHNGWLYDPEKVSVKISGDVDYAYEEGAGFQIEMVPLNYTAK